MSKLENDVFKPAVSIVFIKIFEHCKATVFYLSVLDQKKSKI